MEEAGTLRRPIIPAGAEHNAHIYYVLIPSSARRDHTLMRLAELGVDARSHYVPLHAAAAERRFGRTAGSLAKPRILRRGRFGYRSIRTSLLMISRASWMR